MILIIPRRHSMHQVEGELGHDMSFSTLVVSRAIDSSHSYSCMTMPLAEPSVRTC